MLSHRYFISQPNTANHDLVREVKSNNMNQTLIAFWNWTSITVREEELDNSRRIEDIFSLDLSIIIVLSLSLVSIIFCCVLQR